MQARTKSTDCLTHLNFTLLNSSKNLQTPIGIADDQQLFLKSLGTLINTIDGFNVVVEAMNGADLLKKLDLQPVLPEIMLLDVNMPVMDGIATAKQLTEKFPQIKLVALSVNDDDLTIISMLRAGCCAYLLKDMHPDELEKALHEVSETGRYNADVANINYRRLLLEDHRTEALKLSAKEMTFLALAASERTYKQIASEMHLSERTIDGYREALFEKLNVQSRVGMVMEGLRRKLISI
jgi:DNA-binding NarL/FixJ family response regulator